LEEDAKYYHGIFIDVRKSSSYKCVSSVAIGVAAIEAPLGLWLWSVTYLTRGMNLRGLLSKDTLGSFLDLGIQRVGNVNGENAWEVARNMRQL